MDCESMVKLVNAKRKANKNKWYVLVFEDVDGKYVEIKGYNTWLQIYRVNGRLRYGGECGISVKQFTEALRKPFAV